MQDLKKESVTLPINLALHLHAVIGTLPASQFGKLFVDFTNVLIQNEQEIDEPAKAVNRVGEPTRVDDRMTEV